MMLDVKLTKPKLIQLIHIAKSKLNMDELSTKDFLKEPLEVFNENSKSKKI